LVFGLFEPAVQAGKLCTTWQPLVGRAVVLDRVGGDHGCLYRIEAIQYKHELLEWLTAYVPPALKIERMRLARESEKVRTLLTVVSKNGGRVMGSPF
jgi:hypothetical protein